ncbi:PIN domain-containing protein [Candidatus Woesearchaeota archaeon]|jgi:tRNA(fMet)-specific endonuclease VapC|nr:PIN domain-containing protein [Candidatus Woesearchaeota archaeon]
MRYILDTDVIIEYLRSNDEIVSQLNNMSGLNVSTVSLCELYFGAYNSGNPTRHTNGISNFLFNVKVLDLDQDSSVAFGIIKSKLIRKGKIIDDFDISIASIALTNNMTLITRNIKHYKNVENLRIKAM